VHSFAGSMVFNIMWQHVELTDNGCGHVPDVTSCRCWRRGLRASLTAQAWVQGDHHRARGATPAAVTAYIAEARARGGDEGMSLVHLPCCGDAAL